MDCVTCFYYFHNVLHTVDSPNVYWIKSRVETIWIYKLERAQKQEKERWDVWHLKGNNLCIHIQFTSSSFSVTIYFIYLTNKSYFYDNNCTKSVHMLSVGKGAGACGRVRGWGGGAVSVLGNPVLALSQISIQKSHGLSESHPSSLVFLLPERCRLCLQPQKITGNWQDINEIFLLSTILRIAF